MAEAEESFDAKVNVKKTILAKAVKALKEVVAKQSANANPLFGAATETMNCVFTLSKIPEKRSMKSVLIPLPHPLYDDKSDICFISKDPQKQYKELLLQRHTIPGLNKVISLNKLQRNYKTIEEKRALADAFDLFVCDRTVVEDLPRTLGSIFYKKKLKIPIAVHLSIKDPVRSLEKAIKGTALRVPAGACVGVKIGRCSMSEEQLVANASSVIGHTVKYLSRIGNPVQSVMVQATSSVALPVWRRPRPPGELLDLKRYRSDASSSAASDTGVSGASETEGTGTSDAASESLETLSQRDSISEAETSVETLSELEQPGESLSEMDSEVGDVDEDKPPAKQDLPLVKGLKKLKKRRASVSLEAEAITAPAGSATAVDPAAADKAMAPPAPKKAKKKAKPHA